MPAWTPTTLKAQIVGELNQARNAAGGTVPTRLANIITEAYEHIWYVQDWYFRRRRGTLTLAADDETEAMPTDFDKFDQKWLEENNDHGRLFITTDPQQFSDRLVELDAGSGTPRIAIVEPSVSEGAWAVQMRLAPACSKAFEYYYYYLVTAPAVGATATPLWPTPFNRLWHDLSLARAQRAFRRDDVWRETWAAFAGGMDHARSQNNETVSSSTPAIRDGYGDVGAMLSSQYSRRTFG